MIFDKMVTSQIGRTPTIQRAQRLLQVLIAALMTLLSVSGASPALVAEPREPEPARELEQLERADEEDEAKDGSWFNSERLSIVVGLGGGLSYTDAMLTTGLLEVDQGTAEFRERLGLDQAYTLLNARLTARYILGSRSRLYLRLPVGLVQERAEPGSGRLPGIVRFSDYKPGLGDASFGYTRLLTSESRRRPEMTLRLGVDSAFARYTTLGDGLWGLSARLTGRKYLGTSYYGLGTAGYTHRLGNNGVEPGGVATAGLGFGKLLRSGRWKLEAEVVGLRAGETTAETRTLHGETTDLVFRLGLVRAADGLTFNVNLTGLSEGLDIQSNTLGFDVGMPIAW